MKSLFTMAAALVLLAVTAFATSYGNVTFTNTDTGSHNTCTLTGANNHTITIPAGSTVTIVDEHGTALVNQPPWSMDPNMGTPGLTITITLLKGNKVPPGGGIKISRLDTQGTDPLPSSHYGDT